MWNKLRSIFGDKRFREFVRFCIVGVAATVIHYGIYLLLDRWINVNIAYSIGYAVSLCCNLWLTAHFTFGKDVTPKRTAGFLVSHGVNFLMHMLFLNLFLWIGIGVRTVFKKLD